MQPKLTELFSFCFCPGYFHFHFQTLLFLTICQCTLYVFSLTLQGKLSLSLVSTARYYLASLLLIIKHPALLLWLSFFFYSSELRSFCLIQTHLQGQKVKFHSSLNAPAHVTVWRSSEILAGQKKPLCIFLLGLLSLVSFTPHTTCACARDRTEPRG